LVNEVADKQGRILVIHLAIWAAIFLALGFVMQFYFNGVDFRALALGAMVSVVSIVVAFVGYGRWLNRQDKSSLFTLILMGKPIILSGIILYFLDNKTASLMSVIVGMMIVVPAALSTHVQLQRSQGSTRRMRRGR
jgi:hypothetical protein